METRIRKAVPEDAAGIARAHVASWQSAYRGLIADEVLDGLSVERRTEFWYNILSNEDRPSFHFVAENENGIAGFVSAGPEREDDPHYKGEVNAIYLHPSAWRQGIGRKLMHAAAQELLAHGFNNMLLWVLRDNTPSRKFYEALGGKVLREKPIEIGGRTLIEVAYGYDNLHSI
jgi:GNAT superfamily N-acetyltransferase